MPGMRIALAFALLIGTAPAAALAGNTVQNEQVKKQACARPAGDPQRAKAPRTDCRTRTVPPIVDPTPTFIL